MPLRATACRVETGSNGGDNEEEGEDSDKGEGTMRGRGQRGEEDHNEGTTMTTTTVPPTTAASNCLQGGRWVLVDTPKAVLAMVEAADRIA